MKKEDKKQKNKSKEGEKLHANWAINQGLWHLIVHGQSDPLVKDPEDNPRGLDVFLFAFSLLVWGDGDDVTASELVPGEHGPRLGGFKVHEARRWRRKKTGFEKQITQ